MFRRIFTPRVRMGLGTGAAVAVMAVVGVGICPDRATAASDPQLQAAMQRIVDGGFPGAWAVDSAGKTGAAGQADIATHQATQPDMAMRVGSITKSFVGAVALQLVAEGRLSLDDTVSQKVPGLLSYGDQVTVRMLLQHTSGIPDYFESGSEPLIVRFINDPTLRTRTWTPEELVGLIASQHPNFHPGARAQYSDTNYIVLGLVLRSVTQTAVETEVQNRIITPLHLTHTVFPTTDSALPAPFAHGYSYPVDSNGYARLDQPLIDLTNYNPSILGTMGAVVSTPEDLNTFMGALLGGRLLPANLTAQMKQTVPLHQPLLFPPTGFGMGLGIWSWDLSRQVPGCAKVVYGHEGEAPGYDSWSFGTADGSRVVSMGVNLVIPDWDAYYDIEMKEYAKYLCSLGS